MNGRIQQQSLTDRRGYDSLQAGREGHYRRDGEAEAVMQIFSFGPFRIVPYARILERGGSPTPLSSRAFDILCILVSRPGQIVSKGELIARTWPDVTVEESSLRFHINQLRRALGDGQGSYRYVLNVPGRGYCFVAYVSRETLPINQVHETGTASSVLMVPAVARSVAI